MALHSHTVLVVEDDPFIRLYLSDCLEEEGYHVLEASNVLEAIAMLGRHGKIDALVTDIDMPGTLNGLDLARLVRGYAIDISIIVTSGGHVITVGDLPTGSRFIAKPYRMADVLSCLSIMIRAPSLDADIRQAV